LSRFRFVRQHIGQAGNVRPHPGQHLLCVHGLDPGASRRCLVPIVADRRAREEIAADAQKHDRYDPRNAAKHHEPTV
jgi:hypothetical protein